jgi:hypothetical protein
MFSIAVALLGCSTTTGEQPDQLEAPEASWTEDGAKKGAELSGENSFVEGADRDWTIHVVPDLEESAVVHLHLPGASDLSGVSGLLRVSLGDAWGDDTRTVRLDHDGEPLLLVQTSHELGPATQLFGEGFASFGDEVGTGTMEDDYGRWSVSYKTAVFETDDGPVEAAPGEPFVATIDGEEWRVVVHASFEVTDTPDTLPGCGGGIDTTLSFEMRKVEGTPATEPLAPLAGARLAGHGTCG